MTREELERLRGLAAKATPGPWTHEMPFGVLEKQRTIYGTVPSMRVDYVCGADRKIVIPSEGHEKTSASKDMAFIAAANPTAITALIDHIDRLEREANAGRELAEQELRTWWHAFTQCDAHPDGFLDRMELFGLVFSKECTQEDYEQEAFATERGIEVGYPIWMLTEAGHKAYDTATKETASE